MMFFDYHECELRDCLINSLMTLGYREQAEMMKKVPFTIDLINQLIETVITESRKKGVPFDERLCFLGQGY